MKSKQKPKAELIGADGNVFNLIAISVKALKRNGMHQEATEMANRIYASQSYEQALGIMQEYIEAVEVGHDQKEDLSNVHDFDIDFE